MSGKVQIHLKQIKIDNLNELLGAFNPTTDYSTIYFRQGSWYVGVNPKKSTLNEILTSGNTSDRTLVLSGYTVGVKNENIIFGKDSLKNYSTATDNIAIGSRALENAIDCKDVIAIGKNSGSNNQNGQKNIFIGNNSGASNNFTNNIVIGHNSLTGTNNSNNVIICNDYTGGNYLGMLIIGNGNNHLISGNFFSNALNFNGDVTIKNKFFLLQNNLFDGSSSELLVRNKLTGEITAIEKPLETSFLTSDENGNFSWTTMSPV